MQHNESTLRRDDNDGNVAFDVRLITRPSQELDLAVFAINLFSGTILFLDEAQCGNVTFDSPTRPVQFLLKNGMCEYALIGYPIKSVFKFINIFSHRL